MAQNLFQTEWMLPYRIRTAANYGEWVDRNGISSMRIGPLPYYNTANTDGSYAYVLHNEFQSGKRYLFDMWIDADNVVSGGKNVSAGIIIRYTDGTSYSLLVSAASTSGNSGFQHATYKTTEGKDVSGFTVYYYTSSPAYYRWDSSITEYVNTDIKKTRTVEDGVLKENSDIASIAKGGMINTNSIIET